LQEVHKLFDLKAAALTEEVAAAKAMSAMAVVAATQLKETELPQLKDAVAEVDRKADGAINTATGAVTMAWMGVRSNVQPRRAPKAHNPVNPKPDHKSNPKPFKPHKRGGF